MPNYDKLTVEDMVSAADKAVAYAQAVRKHHARNSRPGGHQREADIRVALQGLQKAMKPIRHWTGRFHYRKDLDSVESLRMPSRAIQAERRKLWKMVNNVKKRRPRRN